MSSIFLSYRRGPGASETVGRLHDRLAAKYGKSNVFMDVDTVRPGSDFVSAVSQAIESSEVVLAVIDPQWAVDAAGRDRIAEAGDYVRLEIGTAVHRGVTVIPVLILGAEMPTPDRLPPDLQPLTSRQAVVLSHERFTTDVLPLELELDDLLGSDSPFVPPRERNERGRRRARKVFIWVLVSFVIGFVVLLLAISAGN